MITFEEIKDIIEKKYSLESIPVEPHQPATNYRFSGFKGRVGFISSMTNPFCSSCNRVRLTADGSLKVCLHDEIEVSLRDYIREGASDSEIEDQIYLALTQKKEAHIGAENISKKLSTSSSCRPMIKIGG